MWHAGVRGMPDLPEGPGGRAVPVAFFSFLRRARRLIQWPRWPCVVLSRHPGHGTPHPESRTGHLGPPHFAAAGACRLAGTRLMRVQRRSCTAAHRLTLLQSGWKESSSRSSGHATHPREGKRSPREVGPGSYRLVPGVNHAFPADSAWPELSGWFLCGHPAGTRGKLPSCCMSNYTATRAGSAPPDQRVSGGQVRRPRAPGRSCL